MKIFKHTHFPVIFESFMEIIQILGIVRFRKERIY